MKPTWTAWVLLTVLALPRLAESEEIWPYRVAVLSPAPVFTDPRLDPDEARTPRLSYPALIREVDSAFDFDPRYAGITEEELTPPPSRQDSGAFFADIRRENGISLFGDYEINSAIDNLEEAVSIYRGAGADRQNTRELAESYEYLARAYIERASTEPEESARYLDRARRNFEEMIRYAPGANLREGYYPPAVVSEFQQAYYGLLANEGSGLLLRDDAALNLATLDELDYIVYPLFYRDDDGIWMVLQIWSTEARRTVSREVIELTDETAPSLERVNRAVSRFLACVPIRYEVLPPPVGIDAEHLFLQVGWGMAVYGAKPTAEQFLNQGLGLTLSYNFTEDFGVFGRTSVIFAERDPNGNLLSTFTSFRSALGVDLSIRANWFRFFLGIGVELNRVGGFTATDEFWCKVSGGVPASFGSIVQTCTAFDITTQSPTYLIGPFLMPGFAVDIFGRFSGYLQGGFSFYLNDFVSHVDFPLGGEVGIQYRF